MRVKKTKLSDTKSSLTIEIPQEELEPIKLATMKRLGSRVRLPGFREGKAPASLLEKNLDPTQLQTEFLNEAINQFYLAALDKYRLRPVAKPSITIKKFVPFTTLGFEAELEHVGDITLIDYKKLRKAKKPISVTDKDVKEVIAALRKRLAKRNDVNRAAQNGDEVWIDFSGVDAKKEPVKGAEGKDYPLLLGSDTFIPGFEANLVGLNPGETKTFVLPFPKDYGLKALAGRKVTFTVEMKKVQEVVEPPADDAFAAEAGPFKTLTELKADIKKQLKIERQHEADRQFENELVKEIADKSKVAIPESLIEEQSERLLKELRQNLAYRGQSYPEYLATQGQTEAEYREKVLKAEATERVRIGLILSEIAEAEGLRVTNEEVQNRLELMKRQHTDPAAQASLNKPEAASDIASRLLTEKTLAAITTYVTAAVKK